MKPIIVFDFDGVVCDSTAECMVTSWNAWERWHGRSGYRPSLDDFSKSERDAFRPLRPYVRGAGEYYVLRRCLEENIPISGQSDFENYCQAWMQYQSSFKEVFFKERARMRAENLQGWLDLHPVWPEVVNVFEKLYYEHRAYIATLKDGESVRLIFAAHNVSLSARHLLDQSKIANKLAALEMIRNVKGCSVQDIVFLDDNALHLLEPLQAGYPCYLTTWGNTLPEYRKIAETNGIPLADLQGLDSIVMGRKKRA